jgi:hypothetical protein
MGKSQQSGWVSLRGKYWYGYFRETTLDPDTEEERVKKIPIRLGLKTQEAQSARSATSGNHKTQWTSSRKKNAERQLCRLRVVCPQPLLSATPGVWRPATAVTKMDKIEIDLIGKFGEYSLDALDKFVLHTHALAERFCQDRVKQARSYLKSIFDEAIEQEYLAKDPTRKLKTPKKLRPKDKRVLSWEMWSNLAIASRRDRLLLALDMTEALRPSELFALRWRSFDDVDTLSITETVYRRKLRPYGKTPGSLTEVHLPEGLADELRACQIESGDVSPDDFIFPTRMAPSWIPPIIDSGC